MNLNVTICIDDTHPEKGWGLPEDECVSYLHKLNKEFGILSNEKELYINQN